jgi:arylsulfatase A-like enzyme
MALLLTLAGCGGPGVAREQGTAEEPAAELLRVPFQQSESKRPGDPKPASGPQQRPNIVLVLMDDFSMDLLPTMRSAAAMRRVGASYSHSFVIDSLCCVSRASLLTGQYPHQTGVRTNQADAVDGIHPMGGYQAFAAYGNEERTFATRLQQARYTTGFVGKFLNEYTYLPGGPVPPLPPGWDEFNVLFATAYDGWGFHSSYVEDGQLRIREHPTPSFDASVQVKDRSYAGSVISRQALGFIDRHRGDSRPWFLEVAPYAPHNRAAAVGAWPGEPEYPAMFRDRPRPGHPGGNCGPLPCAALGVEGLPGRGDGRLDNAVVRRDGSTVEPWVGGPVQVRKSKAEETLRDRARMVQSVDRMVTRILREVPRNTYVVLTSDNGLHVGEHGLGIGKGAAYDSDIHVPLLVVGPGVRPGERRQVVSNIDLAPTFEDLAGLRPTPQRSGTSLVPTLMDPDAEGLDYAFVEHTWSDIAGDPDRPAYLEDKIPSYVAVRSRSSLLVRYDLDPDPRVDQHAWEFYDYDEADFERTNEYAASEHSAEVARLTRRIEWLDRCSRVRGDDPVPARCHDLRR